MTIRRVLIAVDRSTAGAHAAQAGIDIARQLAAEMAFVTVVDPSSSPMGACDDEDSWVSMAEQDARDLLKAFEERAAATPPALIFMESGKPAEKIVEAARRWPADLIVTATHGRTAIANAVLGSVAQGILHHAPCPVLVLKAP